MKIFNKISVITLVVSLGINLSGIPPVVAATAVSLGTADSFAVLAGTAITDAVPTGAITGDVGLSPAAGSNITGLTSAQVSGTIYAVDATGPDGAAGNNPALVNGAKTALVTAYDNAAGQTPAVQVGDLGGQTLTPGVYEDNNAPDSMAITAGTKILTLNAQGDANAVFVFKSGSTLTTAANSQIVLINGAQACNVFWQVTSSATLGTGTLFKGNILALTSITDNGGSTVEGRLLARNGAVSLNNTTVAKATCVVPPAPAPVPVLPPTLAPEPLTPPLISVTKIPTPLALPSGSGSVTYDYTVLNVGTVAMGNVAVTDNKCATVAFLSGDTNGDVKLDVSEAWKYRCTTTLSETTTNTVTATGQANGFTAIDTANATVVVSAPLVPPLIHVVKKPNVFVLPAGGGAVTYTYTVTNPGTAPLDNVSVIDNKCTGLPGRVVGHPGDLNQNNLLESNESWTFTCQTNLTQTTINTGTAEGHANGLTAIDFSLATVVVTPPIVPSLPNTGIAPEGDSSPRNIVIPAGIFAVSILFYFVRRKQTI